MTDIFRLLTRSTAIGKKRTHPAPTSAVESSSPAQKRKLDKPQPPGFELPPELDFFGTTHNLLPKTAHPDPKAENEAMHSTQSGSVEAAAMVPELSPQETIRKLRDNRLKFTLLRGPIECNSKRKEKERIREKKRRPELPIPPLASFEQLRSPRYALSSRLRRNVLAQGYKEPTPVQMAALPVLLDREAVHCGIDGISEGTMVDFVACAPTGSGKTMAYVLPLLSKIMGEKDSGKGVKAIIVAPTKELAGQIVNEVRKFSLDTKVHVTAMQKGVQLVSPGVSTDDDDKADTVVKSDIIVSTPATLLHSLEGHKAIPRIEALVLDEADLLLDLFKDTTIKLWSLLRDASPQLQTTLWTATLPASIESLITSTPSAHPLIRLLVAPAPTNPIKQSLLYAASERGKLLAIRQLITSELLPPLLVFVQSIPRAQALFEELEYDLPTPNRIAVLHADLPNHKRTETMSRFLSAEIWVLITTDLLARGVDFRGVRMVVNYDIPTSVAGYIHRIGRAGRAGGEGRAVTYYTKEDIRWVKGIANVVSEAGGEGAWMKRFLPDVKKEERRKFKTAGVESRRGGKAARAIESKSSWERRREDRIKGAVKGSKRRKRKEHEDGSSDDGGSNNGGGVVLEEEEEEFKGFG